MLELIRACGYRDAQVLFPSGAVRLSAMIAACGVERRENEPYDWHGLSRGNTEFAIFQYTLSGVGKLTVEGQPFEVAPGQAMLLYVPQDHRYWLESGEHWELFHITLRGREIVRIFRELSARIGPVVSLSESGVTLERAARLLDTVLNGRLTSPFEASHLAYGLAMGLLEETAPKLAPRLPGWYTKLVRYCRANLERPIGVEDMAHHAGLSRYHFSRLFTELAGVSPGQFLIELRMQEAVRLVRDTRAPVNEIALAVGFSSPNYFCKAFRKRFGVAPGTFRKSGMYG